MNHRYFGVVLTCSLAFAATACAIDSAEPSVQSAEAWQTADASADAATDAATDAGTDAPIATDASSGHLVHVDVGGADGFSFEPKEVTIHPGDKVVWTWTNGKHNVVSGKVTDGEGTADGVFCNPGGAACSEAPLKRAPNTYEHTFATVGDFSYFCAPHADMGMVGVIHVRP